MISGLTIKYQKAIDEYINWEKAWTGFINDTNIKTKQNKRSDFGREL
jgi:hypothetical protein